jgi:hypothetical protein
VFLFLSIRSLGFGRTVSAFGALLFAFSLSSVSFLPGMYGAPQLAALFLSIFLLLLCNLRGRQWLAVPAAIFAFTSAFISAPFGIAAIAATLSFAAAPEGREKGRLVQLSLLLVAAAAGTFISQDAYLRFTMLAAKSAAPLLAFVIGPACCAAVLYFSARETIRDFLLFLLALPVSVLSAPAGCMLLSVAASAGMSRAFSQKIPKALMLACAFFLVFFSVAGLALLAGANYFQALVASILLSALSPLLLHFYDYRSAHMFSVAALALALISLFAFQFASLSAQGIYPAYADKDVSSALYFLSQHGARQVGMVEGQDAASFYLPSAQQEKQADVFSYLSSGKPVPESGTYLIVSLSDLDSWQDQGFTSYAFAANYTTQSGQTALFISPSSGMMLARDVSQDGALALSDGVLLDNYGRSYSTAPLSRMVLLQQGEPFY